MYQFMIILFTAVLAVIGGPMLADDLDERILDGVNATKNQRPFQASLRYSINNFHFCGGAIITDRWILTVAHCLHGLSISSFHIMVGSIYSDSNKARYGVQKAIPHPKHNMSNSKNDIGLVKTINNIRLGQINVNSIPLYPKPLLVNVPIVVSGWGWTDNQGSHSKILQILYTKSIRNSVCKRLLASVEVEVFSYSLCTFTRTGQGLCYGDSGSPMTYKNKLAGVVSGGVPCGMGYPDFGMAVYDFRSWIESTMANN